MATVQIIVNAINKASKPLLDIAANAQEAADRIDALNGKIDKTDRAMAGFEGAARLAESGMRAAGREADVLAVKLARVNDKLDDLARPRTARIKVDVDRSAWGKIGHFFTPGGGTGGAGNWFTRGPLNTGGSSGLGMLFSNPYILGGGAAVAALGSPVLAQGLAGTAVLGLGSGLAGLGILGAFGAGKAPSALQLTAAADRLAAAQDSLRKLQASSKTTPGQLASGQAAVASAQDTLNKLQANAIDPAQARMRASFANFTNDVQDSLVEIGKPFRPVMTDILHTATSVLDKMTPVFANAEKTIAGPFKIFGDTLVNSFAQPAVKASIGAVAGSFGLLLKTLTPQLGYDVAQVADGISRIARSVADHPQAFADFVKGFFKLTGIALDGISALANFGGYLQQHFWPAMHRTSVIWDGVRHEFMHITDDMTSALIRTWGATWNDTIGVLIRFGHDVEKIYDDFRHRTAVVFDGVRGELGRIWNDTWNESVGALIRFGHNVETQFNSLRHSTAVVFDGVRHDIAAAWDLVWTNTVGREIRGIGDVVRWFGTLPGRALDALKSLGGKLYTFGASVISQLWSGLKSVWGGIAHWFTSLPGDILHALGIHSPPDWAVKAGENIAEGLFGWTSSKRHHILTRAAGLAGSVGAAAAGTVGQLGGGNVISWITAALQATNSPPSWLGAIEALVARESGGNPLAYNPVSVFGQHAEGIAQTLPSTFAAYSLGGSIWNPVSDLIASLRYIRAIYGSPFNIPGLTGGTYKGYDSGGILPPGFHLVANLTGRPEEVVPAGGSPGAGRSGPLIHVGEMHVHDEADAAVVAQRLSGMIRMASLGGGFRR